ncbi:hypothetical protein QEN19_001439 [Hanseniaspora menglaensis]
MHTFYYEDLLKEYANHLNVLLETFYINRDIYLTDGTNFISSGITKCKSTTYTSFESNLAISLIHHGFHSYQKICERFKTQNFFSKDQLKEFVDILRINSYIFNHYSDNVIFDSKDATYLKALSNLMLACSQEILYKNVLLQETGDLQPSESLLSKVAMGVYDLYNNIGTLDNKYVSDLAKEVENKKNFFKARAQYHYLSFIEKTFETKQEEIYSRYVFLLKCLSKINTESENVYNLDLEINRFVTNLTKEGNQILHSILRDNGAIEYDSTLINLKSTILVTRKVFQFDQNRDDLLPNVPYYTHYKRIEDHIKQESEIAKSYKSLIIYNKNNLTKLIDSRNWQNVICQENTINANEYKQLGEFVTNLIPAKRINIKKMVDKHKSTRMSNEIENYLSIGLKIDEENIKMYLQLEQATLFNLPKLSLNNLMAGLKYNSIIDEQTIKLLVKTFDQAQKYVLQLSSKSLTKNFSEKQFENFLNSNYPLAGFQKDFNYQEVFKKCITIFYDSKYKSLLMHVDAFVIDVSQNNIITALYNKNVLLFDENIAKYNTQIKSYQRLCKNVEQGSQFYKDLEKKLANPIIK